MFITWPHGPDILITNSAMSPEEAGFCRAYPRDTWKTIILEEASIHVMTSQLFKMLSTIFASDLYYYYFEVLF